MKVSMECYGKKVTVEVSDGIDLYDLRDDVLIPLLVAFGFHADSVNELFYEEVPEHTKRSGRESFDLKSEPVDYGPGA